MPRVSRVTGNGLLNRPYNNDSWPNKAKVATMKKQQAYVSNRRRVSGATTA